MVDTEEHAVDFDAGNELSSLNVPVAFSMSRSLTPGKSLHAGLLFPSSRRDGTRNKIGASGAKAAAIVVSVVELYDRLLVVPRCDGIVMLAAGVDAVCSLSALIRFYWRPALRNSISTKWSSAVF